MRPAGLRHEGSRRVGEAAGVDGDLVLLAGQESVEGQRRHAHQLAVESDQSAVGEARDLRLGHVPVAHCAQKGPQPGVGPGGEVVVDVELQEFEVCLACFVGAPHGEICRPKPVPGPQALVEGEVGPAHDLLQRLDRAGYVAVLVEGYRLVDGDADEAQGEEESGCDHALYSLISMFKCGRPVNSDGMS